ncbi:hypothetical protein [Paenibacillus eucommiae]|uniref:Membrane carboxypeptidase/penicillin-binding protein n=1 Tax=Paenibacillus eucommiae TaxID=1355755 RepID=A0ABS4ILR5_9BACL|nr:hypothetical protein [Paenibacillus eucommiae]MBP1988460.1 membrane carboxypeptidase/penicillin-binding protein [Paenibacillus eucommiae]
MKSWKDEENRDATLTMFFIVKSPGRVHNITLTMKNIVKSKLTLQAGQIWVFFRIHSADSASYKHIVGGFSFIFCRFGQAQALVGGFSHTFCRFARRKHIVGGFRIHSADSARRKHIVGGFSYTFSRFRQAQAHCRWFFACILLIRPGASIL